MTKSEVLHDKLICAGFDTINVQEWLSEILIMVDGGVELDEESNELLIYIKNDIEKAKMKCNKIIELITN